MLAKLFTISFLAAPLVALANPHGSHHNRHVGIAKRQSGDVQLHKRFSGARWTFYDVGLGACGKNNVASDFIVALNSDQYGAGFPGPNCFKTITMTYNGKTTSATIMDECPGCPYGGLDLSRGLFTFFAPEADGVLYGIWNFDDGSGGSGGDAAPAAPKTTSTKTQAPKPTPTWMPPISIWKAEPTTTWKPEPTTSSKESSTTHSSSSSSSSSSKSSSTSTSSSISKSVSPSTPPVTVPSVTPSDPKNLGIIDQILLQLGDMAVAAVTPSS